MVVLVSFLNSVLEILVKWVYCPSNHLFITLDKREQSTVLHPGNAASECMLATTNYSDEGPEREFIFGFNPIGGYQNFSNYNLLLFRIRFR